ncbi:MAG: sigma-70 family RNA polymerase sigma factor [Anaerohalosphaeraceae bacterium]
MDSKQDKTEEFLSLLMSNQQRIHGYVLSLVPNRHDADDLMQETITILWRKFDEFQTGTNFASWGMKVAHYRVLNYRTKKAKDRLVYSEDLLNQIHDVALKKQKYLEEQNEHLSGCIQKLQTNDQRLLKARYELGRSVQSLAAHLDRSTQYVYKHLARIHHALRLCVKRAYRQGGLT